MNARMKRFLSVVVAGAGVGALALLAFTLLSITDTREVEACTPPTYYTLTINIEGQGSTNPASGGSYLSGATASINPTPSRIARASCTACCHQPPRRKLRASWSKFSGASRGPK